MFEQDLNKVFERTKSNTVRSKWTLNEVNWQCIWSSSCERAKISVTICKMKKKKTEDILIFQTGYKEELKAAAN